MRPDCSGCKFLNVENLPYSKGIGKYYRWFCKKDNRVVSEFVYDMKPKLPIWCPLKKEAEEKFYSKGKITP